MRGLRTARVLVLDDDPLEAEPLLRGLGKLGIGSLYFNGDVDDLPDAPLEGVRLVFLDLRLGGGLTDAAHAVGHTVTVLKRLVRAAKGETAVVLWTKHEEDEPAFKDALRRQWPAFEPAFSMRLSEKIRFVSPDRESEEVAVAAVATARLGATGVTPLSGEFTVPANDSAEPHVPVGHAAPDGPVNEPAPEKVAPPDEAPRPGEVARLPPALAPLGVDELRNRITQALTDHGHRLLWEWEQCIHDAASATAAILLEMKARRPETSLMTVLAKLAEAPGYKIDDGRAALAGLFEGLNPVHADYLRRFARQDNAAGPHVDALLALLQGDQLEKLPQPELALLNRFMLADAGNTGAPYPGDVFLAREWEGVFPGGVIDETKKRLIDEIFKDWKPEDPRRASAEVCLTEITAACDFAQEKAYNARLLYGLLFKAAGTNTGKDKVAVPETCRGFAREIEFVRIEEAARGLDGDFRIVMNARWIYSCPVADLAKQKSIIRLRDQVITDVRAWFASHASRPGYVSVR